MMIEKLEKNIDEGVLWWCCSKDYIGDWGVWLREKEKLFCKRETLMVLVWRWNQIWTIEVQQVVSFNSGVGYRLSGSW